MASKFELAETCYKHNDMVITISVCQFGQKSFQTNTLNFKIYMLYLFRNKKFSHNNNVKLVKCTRSLQECMVWEYCYTEIFQLDRRRDVKNLWNAKEHKSK